MKNLQLQQNKLNTLIKIYLENDINIVKCNKLTKYYLNKNFVYKKENIKNLVNYEKNILLYRKLLKYSNIEKTDNFRVYYINNNIKDFDFITIKKIASFYELNINLCNIFNVYNFKDYFNSIDEINQFLKFNFFGETKKEIDFNYNYDNSLNSDFKLYAINEKIK